MIQAIEWIGPKLGKGYFLERREERVSDLLLIILLFLF